MVSLQLNDAVAAALGARAAAQGLSVEAYLQAMISSSAPPTAPRLSVDELDRLLDDEAAAAPSPTGTFSRSELYDDHD